MHMHKVLILAAMVLAVGTHSQAAPDALVLVKGGVFKNTKSNYHKRSILVPSFYIGKYEVTQKEWVTVMGSNPSEFKGTNCRWKR
jgi:formylglycine-generating enzyme required for sulfatase activity